MRWLALGAILLLVLGGAGATQAAPAEASTTSVRVTHYYATGNPTYSGIYPYHGSAACSWNFPLGTVLQFWDGRVVTCIDRGLLGWNGWVDIFAATWAEGRRIQQSYEYYAGREVVEILRWGWGE